MDELVDGDQPISELHPGWHGIRLLGDLSTLGSYYGTLKLYKKNDCEFILIDCITIFFFILKY